jgi:hypothetical protein
MSPHEIEVSPTVKLSIGFYDQSDNPKLEEKIAAIQSFILARGGTCQITRRKTTLKNADIVIEFQADIPQSYADEHHTFDSVLNSTTRPDSFGVAWVERR